MVPQGNLGFWIVFTFGSIGVAQGVQCPIPSADVNSKVTYTGLDVGASATYTCDRGYLLFGSPILQCGETGKWIGEPPVCATNVAWRKPVNQSSTARGGEAENANDGDLTTEHDGNKCTQTLVESAPWWSVDLLQEFEVSVIRITTRGCCGHPPLGDLEVRVGDSPTMQKNRLCAWETGPLEEGTTKEIRCARPIRGRYVMLQMVGVEGSLSLCEVEVFSKEELSKNRCESEASLEYVGLFNQTCFEFKFNVGGSFHNAKGNCTKRRGGNLIQKITPLKQRFIVSELQRLEKHTKKKMFWIGVEKEPQLISRVWRWLDGSQVRSPPWGREQPNNYNGNQNCVALDGSREWLWNDVGCELNYLHWICEFEPSCGSPDTKDNATYLIIRAGSETRATYSCPQGNMVIGDKERTCEGHGQWSGEAPACKYVDCGIPRSVENGVLELVDARTTFGASASYSCSENYTLSGEKSVKCGSAGAWDSQAPQCLYSWCPPLESLKNGHVAMSGRRAGDTATYTCDPGYYQHGIKTLSCALGGTWSGEPPVCKFVDCGLPENIENGKLHLVNSTTYVGSIAAYQCSEDYWLDGLPVRLCEPSGFWTGAHPSCIRISCEQPEVPIGGVVTGYSLDVHSVIEYRCEAGHFMTGQRTRVCTREGMWSGDMPNCTFIDCGKIMPIAKGEVRYLSDNEATYLDSSVEYSCFTNHRLIGTEKRICQQTGQWSGEDSVCEEIRCPEPEQLEKSRVMVSGSDRRLAKTVVRGREHILKENTYRVGSTVTYRCDRGYVVNGSSFRTCQPDGMWSDETPSCIYVDCSLPEKIENGVYRLLSNETNYGAAVAYECSPNWKLKGKVRRFCQENSTWSGPVPECVEVTCASLEKELEAKYKLEDSREAESWNKQVATEVEAKKELRISVDDGDRGVGSNATYYCRRGQRAVGEALRTCRQHGVWDGTEPKCEWVQCPHPSEIENGRIHVVTKSLHYNSVVEYLCFPKYFLKGPFNRTCAENGTWTGEEPSCSPDVGPPLEDNIVDGTSNLARGTSLDHPSNTGMYVGIAVSLLLIICAVLTLAFFKTRQKKLSEAEGPTSSKARNNSRQEVMTYGDLSDPSTGNNIYENIGDDEESGYGQVSRSSSFSSAERNDHTCRNGISSSSYSNPSSGTGSKESYYGNGFGGRASSGSGRKPNRSSNHISQRPRMPPPHPPQTPPITNTVTINGVTVNTT